ncbi:MAG: hypothetical protein ACYC27_13875 [Armatimonadota bacterium]
MRRFIYILSVITILLCASPVFANYSPMPEIEAFSSLPTIILLDLASDMFFILLSLLMLRQTGKTGLSTILKVSIFAMAAGFLADEIGMIIGAVSSVSHLYHFRMLNTVSVIISILLIAYANFNFARYYFKLTDRQSLIMGLIVGVFTMPGGVLLTGGLYRFMIFHTLPFANFANLHDPEVLYTYAIAGTIFTAADIILLLLIKPITSLNRISVGAMGLVIAAGASWYGLAPVIERKNETRQITTCSAQMRTIAHAIMMYDENFGDYPPDISTIPQDLLLKEGKSLSRPYNGLDYLHCSLDTAKSGITSYEYRKPPAYIIHPELLKIVHCRRHSLPPMRSACNLQLGDIQKRINSYASREGRFPENIDSIIKLHISSENKLYCPYADNGKKIRYIYKMPVPEELSQPDVFFYKSLYCPIHPSIPEIDECEKRRNEILIALRGYRYKHRKYPDSIEEIDASMEMSCPLIEVDPIKYVYNKPPDDLILYADYWMLRCTHHQKYDLYTSSFSTPMKGLPKGESYK